MTVPVGRDLSPLLHTVQKIILMLRYVTRFPRQTGAWPKYEYLKPWLAALRPATVVDVGVNAGQFLHLAARLFPAAAIVGIEPIKPLCDRVAAQYGGQSRVTLQCCACGAAEGEADFFVTGDSQNSSTHAPTDAFYDERPGERIVETLRVPVKRLDTLLEGRTGPMLVKIDVQGGEMEVLEGLGDRLSDVAALIIEAPFEKAYQGAAGFDAIYRYLTERGFAYRGALGQLNSPATGHVRQEDSVYLRADLV